MEVSVGIKVAARGLEWDVTEVEPLGSQQRVRLACVGGDLAGLEWDMLYPAEALSVLQHRSAPRRGRTAGRLAALSHRAHAGTDSRCVRPAGPPRDRGLSAGAAAACAWIWCGPRLLLADGVGLGKTIQAGLIAAELLVRRRAHRILIVCPPGPLLRQWEQEMRIRFGLRFTPITDAASLRQARRGLELGGNPFDATALCLTSIDFAKSDRVLRELERASWDLVIIDEAHHCVGEENQRRRLAEVLARQSDGLLLLTATPHDGHDPHFASLMALLDPCLVDGAGRLVGNLYRRHVVRRLKSHIRTPTGAPLFRNRVVTPGAGGCHRCRAIGAGLSSRRYRPWWHPGCSRSRDRSGLTDALAFVSLLKRSMSTHRRLRGDAARGGGALRHQTATRTAARAAGLSAADGCAMACWRRPTRPTSRNWKRRKWRRQPAGCGNVCDGPARADPPGRGRRTARSRNLPPWCWRSG